MEGLQTKRTKKLLLKSKKRSLSLGRRRNRMQRARMSTRMKSQRREGVDLIVMKIKRMRVSSPPRSLVPVRAKMVS